MTLPPPPRSRATATLELWLVGGAGSLLHLGGVWLGLFAGLEELGALAGAFVTLVGVALVACALERRLGELGRDRRLAFAALLGPVGIVGVALLAPATGGTAATGEDAPHASGARPRSRGDRIAAGLLSLGVVASTVVLAEQWSRGAASPGARPDEASQQLAERRAYQRLRTIAKAQARYAQTDWDGDGARGHAAFPIHLWQSVDARGRPVPVGLISRELGFAMAKSFALDGYVFRGLHPRRAGADHGVGPSPADYPSLAALDPRFSWGAVAIPVAPERRWLAFLTDASGRFWAHRETGVVADGSPAGRGWLEVPSLAELVALQRARGREKP